jgi:hypothetical protein
MNPIWLNAIRASAGGDPWYRAGGASGAVRAYQPKGAASLAASYVDLTGNQDAAPGVAPGWDAANGWKPNGSTNYLTTGLTPSSDSYTYLIRTAGSPSNGTIPFGFLDNNKRSYIQYNTTPQAVFANGSSGIVVSTPTSGVLAVNATDGYRNGVSLTSAINDWGAGTALEIYICALKRSGSITNYFNGTIQALAIYNNSLSDAQVLAVSAAMAAL